MSIPGFFLALFAYCISEDVAGSFHAFSVGMGVHSERHRLVGMAQLFGNTGDVGSIGDGDAGECMPELMRMKVWHTVLL